MIGLTTKATTVGLGRALGLVLVTTEPSYCSRRISSRHFFEQRKFGYLAGYEVTDRP
jgi:hypothetical protein